MGASFRETADRLVEFAEQRMRADVVLRKRSDHSVGEVWLRET